MNVKQAANVLELLEFFATHRRPASLAEVAKHFNWPRSSTFNLLGTLASRGFLYEPRGRGGYYPTPLWSSLVRQIEGADPIPEQLHHLLEDLAKQTGETAVLAATSGAYAVFIDSVESLHAIRYAAKPGKMIPMHVTATGRALLAQMPAADRTAILKRATFERYTSTTLMSVASVEKEIRKSTARGWFEGNAEFTVDLGGVALPLRFPHRHLAVLVAGPMSRVKAHSERWATIMAKTISQHLAERSGAQATADRRGGELDD